MDSKKGKINFHHTKTEEEIRESAKKLKNNRNYKKEAKNFLKKYRHPIRKSFPDVFLKIAIQTGSQTTVNTTTTRNILKKHKYMGTINIKLFEDVPYTAANFMSFCTGSDGTSIATNKKMHYQDTLIHRIIPKFMIQGGDTTKGDGTGGESIYGFKFDDENFIHKHDQPYMVSMANCGPHTNGSQFFITLVAAPWLDNHHVCFGKVISGKEVVDKISKLGDKDGNPMKRIIISESGEVIPFQQYRNRNDVHGNSIDESKYGWGQMGGGSWGGKDVD